MALKIKKNPVATAPQVTTSVQHKTGAEQNTSESLPPVVTEGAPALVEVSIGLTRNLGNYESVRLHVGITLPCPANATDIDNAYDEAKGWVDTRIEQLSAEVDKELGGK